MIYSLKLKELREGREIKQYEIAKMLKISKTTYSEYENEYKIMPIKYLNEICNYFKVSLDYIFNITNELTYNKSKNNIDVDLFCKRFKEFRKENKLTQSKLAVILNTTQSTLTGYESGRYIIATPFLYTICKKYGVSADYLLGKIDYIPEK